MSADTSAASADARRELADANRILAHLGVVDAFGHASVRAPGRTDAFLLARSMAPALVGEADVMTLGLDGETLGGDARRSYVERFIHAEIYRGRPDVGAVVHSHSPAVIPFGVVAQVAFRPIHHMAAGQGRAVPVFDIRDAGGDGTDLLVRDPATGAALARTLGAASSVLMRGHGITVAAATLREAVFVAAYAEQNARLQAAALALGPVTYLSDAEVDAAWATNRAQVDRAWALWLRDAAPAAP